MTTPLTAAATAGLTATALISTPGLAASMVSGVGYGTANFLGGLAARRQPVILTLLCSQAVALVLVTAAAALRPGRPDPADLAVGALAGCAAGAGAYLAYLCFRSAQIGVSAVLLGLAQLAVPTAVGLIGAPPSAIGAVGLALAATAIVVLSAPRRARLAGTPPRAALLALGAGAAFGGYHAAMATTAATSGLWPVVAAEAVIVAVAGGIVAAGRRARPTDRAAAGLAAADGATSAIATLAGLVGVRAAALPVAGGLIALLPAGTTVLLAHVLMRQPLPRRSAIGLVVAGAAIALLAVAGAGA